MTAQTYDKTYSPPRSPSDAVLKVESLLSRYPDLSEQELARLIGTMPDLRMADYALITADQRLAEKLKAFDREHWRELKAPYGKYRLLITFGAIVTAGVLGWALSSLAAA